MANSPAERDGFDFDAVKDLMACPKCRSPFVRLDDSLVCQHAECRLKYQIREGIPCMLVDEAVQLEWDEWNAIAESPSD